MQHPESDSESTQGATFSPTQRGTFRRWCERHQHWQTAIDSTAGQTGLALSEFLLVNLPAYFAANPVGVGTLGWTLYPTDGDQVAVVFGDFAPVIARSLTEALHDIERVQVWQATAEDVRLADSIVPAFKTANSARLHRAA